VQTPHKRPVLGSNPSGTTNFKVGKMTISWRNLKTEITQTLDNYDNVFVMVSGGVDSMVLLDLVSRLRKDVNAIHFRHMIRKNDHEDSSTVLNMALDRNLQFFLGYGKNLAGIANQEHEAREQRWAFAESVMETFSGSSIILTAHHYDDNLEQYFMSSMRGSENLVMKRFVETEKYTKYKPLLNIEKSELVKTAQTRNIVWVEDVTNHECDHERNIVRNNIIPEMMKIRNIRKSMRPLIERLAN
jgi:tRNA(Ile)-lysidine synthetase-like protein